MVYDHQKRDQEAKIQACLHGALHMHFISCSSCHSFTVTDSSVRAIVMADFLAATFEWEATTFSYAPNTGPSKIHYYSQWYYRQCTYDATLTEHKMCVL